MASYSDPGRDQFEAEYKPRTMPRERVKALLSYKNPQLIEIKENFLKWVSYSEYLVFKGTHKHTGENVFKGFKSAKRGNNVYSWRLKNRFKPFEDIPNTTFFNVKNRSKRHKTKAIFATLTLKPGKTIDQRWEHIGELYNRWITKLRRRYGVIKVLRVWEAHKSGYPHVHAILLFESKEWEVFHHNGVWRVQGKAELEWGEGWTDIEALASVKGGVKYVLKYLSKIHSPIFIDRAKEGAGEYFDAPEGSNLGKLMANASVLTLALMWAFSRRAFSVSGGFLDSTLLMGNSNPETPGQVDLAGDPVWAWSLIGFWGGKLYIEGRPHPVWGKDLELAEVRAMRESGSWSENIHK